MPDASDRTPFEEIVHLLSAAGVEFLVIGGQAEALHGSARVTYDLDICYRRSAQNLENLATVLRQLKPTLRGAPPDLPFQIDARSLALGSNFTFDTESIPFDLLGHVEPIGGYEELLPHAERYEIGELRFQVIGLDDLIRVKEHIGRPKDRDSLLHLRAIRRIREERGEA